MTKPKPQSPLEPQSTPVQNTAVPQIKSKVLQPISKPDKSVPVPKYILLANERTPNE